MADHRIVKQIDLTNRMEPQTFTVPLYNSNSLTFWLEPGDTRSGQFVIYDITVSKAPCDIITPTDSVVTSPEGRPGEVVETGGALPPPVWAE